MAQPVPDHKPDHKIDYKLNHITHLFFILIVLMCVSFVYWAYHGQLDIVSVADGQVVPSGKIKHIQHLEGGIIHAINVSEGDVVKKGQPLVELEQLHSGASLEEIQIRIDALTIDMIRLKTLIEDKQDLVFSPALAQKHPQLIKDSRQLFLAHKNSVQSKVEKLTRLVEQKRQRIRAVESSLDNKQQRLPLLEEQLSLSEELLKDNLTTRYKHIEIMRQAKQIEGEIKNDKSALKEAAHALAETQASLREVVYAFKEKTIEQLKDVQQEFNEFSVRLKKFEDSLKRTTIRSPINGIIKKLYAFTGVNE